MVNAAEFKVVLHPRGQVEGVTAREVAQHHQVAERLHNVPTQVVEGAQNDECELTYDNRRAEEAGNVCVSLRILSEFVYPLLVRPKFALELC